MIVSPKNNDDIDTTNMNVTGRHLGQGSQTSCHTVGHRIVFFRGIHYFGERFVGHELEGGEGDGHGDCGRIRHIEGGQTFSSEDGSGAGEDGRVGRAVNLHALLDNCSHSSACWRGGIVDIFAHRQKGS